MLLITSSGNFLSTELTLLSAHLEIEENHRLGTARTEHLTPNKLPCAPFPLTFNGERLLTDPMYLLNSLCVCLVLKFQLQRCEIV